MEPEGDDDLDARQVAVQTPDGDSEWTFVPGRVGRDWILRLESPTQAWSGTGPDCFKALRDLRNDLDAAGIRIGLNGARPNTWSSGMQCDMGEGRVTYLLRLGVEGRPETVRTLGAAPLDAVGSIAEQDAFYARWLSERPTTP